MTPEQLLAGTLSLVNTWRGLQQLLQAVSELADPLAQAGHPELVAQLQTHLQGVSDTLDQAGSAFAPMAMATDLTAAPAEEG